MKLWIDDIRPVPDGYIWFKSVNDTLRYIRWNRDFISVIDLDHDAGDWATEGGDYIAILTEIERLANRPTSEGADWAFWAKNCVLFCFHSANPVGVANMRRIIERNGWKEMIG